MRKKAKIIDLSALVVVIVGIVLIITTFGPFGSLNDTYSVAHRVSRILERRIPKLESYMLKALEEDRSRWLELDELPDDMVIYRYCADTLQSWKNEFPIYNDNLQYRVFTPLLTSSDYSLESPLVEVTDTLNFLSLGPRWYLIRSMSDKNCTVIGALEIMSLGHERGVMRINERLKIPSVMSISPLSSDGGSAVYVKGRPQFKILYETLSTSSRGIAYGFWIGITLALCGGLVWLINRKSLFRLAVLLPSSVLLLVILYFSGWAISDRYEIFSPNLYAGNGLLYSLGAVVLINLCILLVCMELYLVRVELCKRIKSRLTLDLSFAGALLASVGIVVYTFFALKNIIINSNIELELYRLPNITLYSILVYISFISTLISVPLLFQTLRSATLELTKYSYNAFSLSNRVGYAIVFSLFLVVVTATLGFRREQGRMEMLANRISFDRDMVLELYLRTIENQIADDPIISALSAFDNSALNIQNRIAMNFFSRRDMNYAVTVYVFNKGNNTRRSAAQYNTLVRGGQSISDNSRFLYVKRDNGRSYYVGIFLYWTEDGSISRVVVRLESRESVRSSGYANIFGIRTPGRVVLPSNVSYGRYEGYELKENRGNYPYPTMLDEALFRLIYEQGQTHTVKNNYTHFVKRVAGNEVIILSRPKISALIYFEEGLFMALLIFLVLTLLSHLGGGEKMTLFEKSYFRSRITGVLLISQTAMLIVISVLSVVFVYSRNENNRHTAMYEKVSSVTAMIEAEVAEVPDFANIERIQLLNILRKVSEDSDSDISLYSLSGTVTASTTPFIFDRMLMSGRMNSDAYGNIIYGHQRYCILQEKMGRRTFYSMYAPVIGEGGGIVAIICLPFSGESFDLGNDAITHAVTLGTFFFLLLLISVFAVTAVVDRLFHPLIEMSSKMDNGGIDSLEPIEYEREDEVHSIVMAYNTMVSKLSESTKRLASAERDKAWSEMARQVAHEIKNPLTPMKLQLQRVKRLKSKGDPKWIPLFDDAYQVLIDHIDILAKTAEDFSFFAKLYTEDPVEVDLDKILQEEVGMYDNRDNIKFSYLGFEHAMVMAPKPQLTRVFVNLLNNAVQAIAQKPDGRIAVSLRQSSTRENYYDIVFEDNGPGVDGENIEKLFTPNFTTKVGGSGLGLAISKNILERSGATISYSRSFALGGACFTICYPIKPQVGNG